MVRAKSHELRRVNKVISEALISGDRIAVFPEGETTFGDRIESFHASLLQPAIAAHAKLYPVAVRFSKQNGEINRKAAYVGETSLMESLWSIVGEKTIYAKLTFLEPIATDGKTRQTLARELEQLIARELGLRVQDRTLEKISDPQAVLQSEPCPTDNPCPAPAGLVGFEDPVPTSVRK